MTTKATLTCSECGYVSEALDLNDSQRAHAWDGWTVGPKEKCPECNGFNAFEEEKKEKVFA